MVPYDRKGTSGTTYAMKTETKEVKIYYVPIPMSFPFKNRNTFRRLPKFSFVILIVCKNPKKFNRFSYAAVR